MQNFIQIHSLVTETRHTCRHDLPIMRSFHAHHANNAHKNKTSPFGANVLFFCTDKENRLL